MRKNIITTSLIVVVAVAASACATKGFVRTEVGGVNSKVDTLTTTVEETQERTRRNETRIGEVDTRAEAAGRSAAEARAAADEANNAARAVDTRLTSSVATVNGRIDATDAVIRKLINEVTLSEDQGNFAFGSVELPDDAKVRLDQVVQQLKADPQLIWIEVEGHTDNIGGAEINQRIGLERAEAVKRYLYMQHQIPLHKINVISYGQEKPVAPNNTRQGRAQNRRVVVRVLS